MHSVALKAIEARVGRPQTPYETIEVKPLTPVIGAEVGGVDLASELSNHQFAEIRRAFLDHAVLVFRDQTLTGEQHKAFGRRFGRLHVHPLQAMREGDNERLEVKASRNSKYVAGEDWHTDVTCDAEPPMGSMLHITEVPEIGCGGDTLFACMSLAWEMLSEPMQALLAPLTAVHDGAIPWVQGYGYRPPDQKFARNEHPVVVRHPETGRRALYVNRGFTSHIVGLPRWESDRILEMLYHLIATEPALHCRVAWRPNTLVFWDNRCTQHHAVWDYFPLDRAGHRVSIIGERPAA